MPSYKFSYFNARGFGEMSRLVFAEAGVSYEDVRYTQETWPEHKQGMLFGQMPVLFVDGEQIAHSRAAVRYLAREFKLDGGSSLNAAKTDMWIEVFVEAMMKFPFAEKDEQKKKELYAQVIKEALVPRLLKFEAAMQGTYLFGDSISVADIMLYAFMDEMRRLKNAEFLDTLPKIKSMMSALEARPKIAKWIAERPETEY